MAESLGLLSSQNLGALVEQKERELHEINVYRTAALEDMVKEKDGELEEMQGRFDKLKEDFTYNLKLLEDRDAELERYDQAFAKMKEVLKDKDGEISEAKINIAELQARVQDLLARENEESKRRSSEASDLQRQRMSEVANLQRELENLRFTSATELQAAKEQALANEREYERKLAQAEEALKTTKQEMASRHELALREAQLAHKSREDELSARLRDVEERLARQREVTEEQQLALDQKDEGIRELNEALKAAEQDLKETQYDLKDSNAVKDATIQELHDRVAALDQRCDALMAEVEENSSDHTRTVSTLRDALHRAEEDHKMEISDLINQHQEELAVMREQAENARMAAVDKQRETEQKVRDAEAELKHLQWDTRDQLKEKQREVDAARKEASEEARRAAAMADRHEADVGRRDAELRALQEREGTLRTYLDDRKEEIRALQEELQKAAAREDELRRGNAQLNLDWETRVVQREKAAGQRGAEMLKTVQKQRDTAQAQLREVERQLSDARMEVDRLNLEMARKTEQSTAEIDHLRSSLVAAEADRLEESGSLRSSALRTAGMRARSPFRGEAFGDSPTSPRGGSKTERALRRENERLRAQLSEMDEQGEEERAKEVEDLREQVRTLKGQNERLRGAIAQMRQDMEQLAQSPQDSTEVLSLQEALEKARAYNEVLLRRNEELSREVTSGPFSQEEIKMLRGQVDELNKVIAKQRTELFDAQDELRRMREAAVSQGSSSRTDESLQARVMQLEAMLGQRSSQPQEGQVQRDVAVAMLQEQVADLHRELDESRANLRRSQRSASPQRSEMVAMRGQLEKAHNDIQRLVEEREKLMEISNMLKADLSRVVSSSMQGATMQAAAGREKEQQFRSQYSFAENEIKELSSSNAALKDELKRWTREEDDGGFQPPASPARGPLASSPRRHTSPARSRAMQRIERVKQNLSLAGRQVQSSYRPPPPAKASDRMVPAQTDAQERLRQMQQRRGDLVAQRRTVRNYNVAD